MIQFASVEQLQKLIMSNIENSALIFGLKTSCCVWHFLCLQKSLTCDKLLHLYLTSVFAGTYGLPCIKAHLWFHTNESGVTVQKHTADIRAGREWNHSRNQQNSHPKCLMKSQTVCLTRSWILRSHQWHVSDGLLSEVLERISSIHLAFVSSWGVSVN